MEVKVLKQAIPKDALKVTYSPEENGGEGIKQAIQKMLSKVTYSRKRTVVKVGSLNRLLKIKK